MDTAVSDDPQIDRLSSLPPELLFHIFDLAYDPDHLLLEPLSKRLLPYFRRDFYFHIRLTTLSSFTKLLRTISRNPPLGDLVSTLDTSRIFFYKRRYEVRGDFYHIVRFFPRIVSVNSGYVRPTQDSPTLPSIASLNHVSYSCKLPVPEDLAALSTPQLRALEVNFLEFSCPRAVTAHPLEKLEKLTLRYIGDGYIGNAHVLGDDFWPAELANVVNVCPTITSLRLFCPDYPSYRSFLSNIPHLAPRLTSLELDSPRLYDTYAIDCLDLLPRFSALTHLSLGSRQIIGDPSNNLRLLPNLLSLRLGPDAHLSLNKEHLFSLVQGPTRLPTLRCLILDCFGNQSGRRVNVQEPFDQELLTRKMQRDGWEVIHFGEFEAEVITRLLMGCERDGVRVEGEVLTVLEDWEDYKLEEANRSVLRCLQLKSLDDVKLGDGSSRFPHMPIDSLDPQNLKLVKTVLPEKDWFRLSLV
ncbi:hypothetical protein JCM5353_004431 [Sporobolomyces roseus]